jgi:DNA replication and repair protein RecF
VERQFLPVWRRYQRALNQRNAALRAGTLPATICAWHKEMSETAGLIDVYRRDYLRALIPTFLTYTRKFFATEHIDLDYLPGWSEQHDLKQILDDAVLADRERGFTGFGAHRAELEIRVDGRTAVGSISRSQQKLLAAALQLAQTRLLMARTGARSLFLIDDLPAELERRHRVSLLQALTELGCQVFVTAIEPRELELASPSRWKRFHVEQGQIRELV